MGGGSPEANEVDARLALAVSAAEEAGAVCLRHFRRAGLGVETKGDGSPVTVADREAERSIRAAVERAFPADGLLGEELGEREGRSGFRWIIDPIDGTASFVAGVPLFGTIIGVDRTGPGERARALAGVIHMPALGESVWAARGGGCTYRGPSGERTPARVSTQARLERARFSTTSVDYFRTEDRRRLLLELCGAFGSERGWGDCYGHLLVATGRVECAIDPVLSPWDIAGVVPIIEEAGGRWTDWMGEVDHFSATGVSSNGVLHEGVVALLRGR
ncbi:MAG: inositol monophosphatase [Phycisphaerae bacterium]|nr:inositol monophosphatase [Phycisphaerae bacterium]